MQFLLIIILPPQRKGTIFRKGFANLVVDTDIGGEYKGEADRVAYFALLKNKFRKDYVMGRCSTSVVSCQAFFVLMYVIQLG